MHSFWEIVASNSLMVAALALGVALLGRVWKNPAAMHLLWLLVLLKLVTPPILTVPIGWLARPTVVASVEPRKTEFIPFQAAATPPQHVVEKVATVEPSAGQPAARSETAPLENSPIEPASPAAEPWNVPWQTVLGCTWAAGIALFASWQAWRIVRFRQLLQAAQPASSDVHQMAGQIAKRLGLHRVPEIRMLPLRMSPLVWCIGGTPRVYLPVELFERLDADAQATILAHELAHIRRKDHWVRLLELSVTTLFWWHPVVWWASRQLQELEEQCCDGLVLGAASDNAKTYATALLDTLDFLSDRSVVAPLGATATKSPVVLARRIAMLKNHTPGMRLTSVRLILLAAVVAVPMLVAFAAESPKPDDSPRSDEPKSAENPAIQIRAVNKLVKDFPEKVDLSTPESAAAAWNRASGRMDAKAVGKLCARAFGPRDIEEMEQFWKRDPKDIAIYNEAQLNAEIIEVATYREDLANVITKLKFPEGVGRHPYSSRCFGKFDGLWKNLGEDRLPSVEAARKDFDRKKDFLWQNYVTTREDLKNGRANRTESNKEADRGAQIAPGEELGISVEKADLMGRIEWFMMHNFRDITARKSIEWGDIEKDKDGNRTVRYKYDATIWDKDVYVMNQVFTFDAKGNILRREDVEGFPRKKEAKPIDASTEKGLKDLVEDFFTKNFRDITARETIEWGDFTKLDDGNASIRYKYRATIWDKDVKIMNQVFTFDPKGTFVSVKDVEGFPQNP